MLPLYVGCWLLAASARARAVAVAADIELVSSGKAPIGRESLNGVLVDIKTLFIWVGSLACSALCTEQLSTRGNC